MREMNAMRTNNSLMRLFLISVMVFLIQSVSFAEEDSAHHAHSTHDNKAHKKGHKSVVETLSPEVRSLLREEMNALQAGMQSVIPAYVSGDLKKIETLAHHMQNSYIFKQNVTREQKQELKSTLPASFKQLDQQFHYFAGMLKHTAMMQKTELIGL